MFLYLAILTVLVASGRGHENSAVEKLIGGTIAAEGEFPYLVSLRVISSKNVLEHFCGGAILSQIWVLTAAHCTTSYKMEKLVVVVGTNQLWSDGLHYRVSKIIRHENYDPDRIQNDVALLKLNQPIKNVRKVASIPLTTEYTPAGVDLVVAGWGNNNTKGNNKRQNTQLKKVTVKSINNDECKRDLGKMTYKTPVTKKNICTFKADSQATCYGDSGGPLVGKGKLVGITSWANTCGRGKPDVFARVSEFAEWIQKKMKQ
ncbi:unnamed protein product [Leptosia nina]|uniref:trypsin n=1 Tax=Leptosia nina TaxID=320188 RepID=A0AAV1JJC4_9NEOP